MAKKVKVDKKKYGWWREHNKEMRAAQRKEAATKKKVRRTARAASRAATKEGRAARRAAEKKLGVKGRLKRGAVAGTAVGVAAVGWARRKKLARLARRGLKVARKLVLKKVEKRAGSIRTLAALARWRRILKRRALNATQRAIKMASKKR